MRNKVLLFGLIIVIMALIVVFGYTNARYYSTASMTGDLDYIKTIGEISLYHPEWIEGYTGPDDGSGLFDVSEIPISYPNIHFKVTNKVDDEINDKVASYYIRIVAEDESNDIPLDYDIHEYNNVANVLNKEDGVGYGPFTLNANSEQTELYSIKANFSSTDEKFVTSIQHLKLQMVKKRVDGTLKVIDETPLNMGYSGSKVKITFAYYLYGTTNPIGIPQTLFMDDNFTIDFKDNAQLSNLGIVIPGGYVFHDVRHNINGSGEYTGTATSVVIPEGYCLSGYYVEVYLNSNEEIAVQINYTTYDGSRYYIFSTQNNLPLPKGLTIDFTNVTQLSSLGIILPQGYEFVELRGNLVSGNEVTSVTIPSNDGNYYIEVLMVPVKNVKINLEYYDSSISESNTIGSQTLENVNTGTVIDFTNKTSLSSLKIKFPVNYKFYKAYCLELDATGAGSDSFEIPHYYTSEKKEYTINIVFTKLEVAKITVPVKFYNSSGSLVSETTVDMNSDATYGFTTENCRKLCPALSTMTSFTVYIANQWGSTYDNVGNTYEKGEVVVDYYKTYTSWADFKLTDEGSYIYIKAWW